MHVSALSCRPQGRPVVKEALEHLDALMNRLVEADQTGAGIEPLRVASELGQIRQLLAESPAVIPAKGGQKHFACGASGTAGHGTDDPPRCRPAGGTNSLRAA